MSTLPPRNIIYYNSGANGSLETLVDLPYTDVIVAFLIPDGGCQLTGAGGAFGSNLGTSVTALRNAGKNVLISVGGASWTTDQWQTYAANPAGLVSNIIDGFVGPYGFSGVDIDYEDSSGFKGAYDGIGFLTALTNGLAANLPAGQNIITHAPQTPYWDPNSPYKAAYQCINGGAGNNITWYNNQFYNNPHYDDDANTKVTWYQNVAQEIGPQKLLVGALVGPSSSDEGYMPLADMTQNVIKPLQALYSEQFGGVMGWEFARDNGGAWATGIAAALNELGA